MSFQQIRDLPLSSDCLIAGNCRELVQKHFQRVSGRQVFEQSTDGNPSADEDRRAAENIEVAKAIGLLVLHHADRLIFRTSWVAPGTRLASFRSLRTTRAVLEPGFRVSPD